MTKPNDFGIICPYINSNGSNTNENQKHTYITKNVSVILCFILLVSTVAFATGKSISEMRAEQQASVISMYTDEGRSTYYGAKNEKENGVLFGICSNGKTRDKATNESMVLTYQEFGQHLLAYNTDVVKKASQQGLAVEFALNCPHTSRDIANTENMSSYLKEISDMFKNYPSVPIYLRFAAEFDIWDDFPEANAFKKAFRFVSDYFKSRNSNVAIVWSPNQVSNAYVNIDDYYPGDEYVDWVGISSYAVPYFLGDKTQSDENMLSFKAGPYSNPVLSVKEIVEKYGNRKPIMLSECRCTNRLVFTGENFTDFALQRLREYYAYLPMIYPQIKLIAYFDYYVDNSSETNDYRLSGNSMLQNEFLSLTKGERFIQDKYSNTTSFCYRKITDGTTVGAIFPASCYAYRFNDMPDSVSYYLDGKYMGTSYTPPFTVNIDASNCFGSHTLKAQAGFVSGKILSAESAVNIYNDTPDISVKISGKRISFDKNPVMYKNRSMVPLRKIFEELGATVDWNGKTNTVSATRGDRTVKLQIGSKEMYVNNTRFEFDVPAILLSGRTLVPARAVAEGLGCDVDWNERTTTVNIEQRVPRWSDWDTSLPSDISEDLFYVERKKEYRYRTRRKEEFTVDHDLNNPWQYVRTDTYYGDWGNWQDSYIPSSDTVEVETRTQSSPAHYYYAHWCTGGNLPDADDRYCSGPNKWRDECDYHELGWFDYQLPAAPDGNGGLVLFKDNGEMYRCSNSCFRYYLMDKTGGDYTQYRSRSITKRYTYWEWGNWSSWSSWDDYNPYNYYDDSVDIDERTVYRYKEK